MLRVDTERRFLPRFKKSGFGAAERIKISKLKIQMSNPWSQFQMPNP
jgi:hypothetical protein